jgi:hypothetical protein
MQLVHSRLVWTRGFAYLGGCVQSFPGSSV